jgi:ankyrin repeat protein
LFWGEGGVPKRETDFLPMIPYNQVRVACQEGDVNALQRLFSDDPTQWRGTRGDSVLHLVAETSHVPVLDWLLTFPLDVNVHTDYGHTPLMWACHYGQGDVVRWLLDHGADPRAVTPRGYTSLHYACSEHWIQGVALLLEYEADPEARTRDGRLPKDELVKADPSYAPLCVLLDAARQGCGLK